MQASRSGSGFCAFVAGATGFTGRELVRLLCARGGRTIAHVRPDSPGLRQWQERFEKLGAQVDTAPWSRQAMSEAVKKASATHIFSLLGTTRARGRRAGRAGRIENYETVDYGLTAMLVHAARESGSMPRFIYLSAAGVSEGARSAYYRARWKAEELIRSSGLAYTIARPSIITGPDRDDGRLVERAGAAAADAALVAAGLFGGSRLRSRYGSTTNTALASSLVRLAFDPKAAGKVIESEDLR